MLRPAHQLVDEARRITRAEQIVGELIERASERVGLESADVMRSLKEIVEHESPPGKEIVTPGRASRLCGAMSVSGRQRNASKKDVNGDGSD
jgi:hypothetical protein